MITRETLEVKKIGLRDPCETLTIKVIEVAKAVKATAFHGQIVNGVSRKANQREQGVSDDSSKGVEK